MGEQDVRQHSPSDEIRVFLKHLLKDVRALEHMLEEGLFEEGVRRVGAEQELLLVDAHWRPATIALELLEDLADPHFTTELGLFNLECNLDPLIYGGDCLRRMEDQGSDLLDKLRSAAHARHAEVVLVGVLPTLGKSDL